MSKKKKVINDDIIKWNSFSGNKIEKMRALENLNIAKNNEKDKIKSGFKYVKINAKTTILKKDERDI